MPPSRSWWGSGRGLRARRARALEIAAVRPDARLAPAVEATIYRLVQESLNNAIKHAGATHAEVTVDEEGGAVRVEVRDDGTGFERDRHTEGFGLVGMRERVALVGGTLEVASERGAGTVVRAVLPARVRSRSAA